MEVQISSKPKYTKKEDIVNSMSHFMGTLFALSVLIVFLVYHLVNNLNLKDMYGYYIYGIFMVMMFTVSGIYHSLPLYSKKRKILRVIDHSDIFLFISATYTPICLYGMSNIKVANILLIANWSCSILAIILNFIDMDNKVIVIISTLLDLIIGWMIMIAYPFNLGLEFNVFLYVLLGGIAFTIGCILYAIGHKKRWFHSVFHIFVLLGVALQFSGVLNILI